MIFEAGEYMAILRFPPLSVANQPTCRTRGLWPEAHLPPVLLHLLAFSQDASSDAIKNVKLFTSPARIDN